MTVQNGWEVRKDDSMDQMTARKEGQYASKTLIECKHDLIFGTDNIMKQIPLWLTPTEGSAGLSSPHQTNSSPSSFLASSALLPLTNLGWQRLQAFQWWFESHWPRSCHTLAQGRTFTNMWDILCKYETGWGDLCFTLLSPYIFTFFLGGISTSTIVLFFEPDPWPPGVGRTVPDNGWTTSCEIGRASCRERVC